MGTLEHGFQAHQIRNALKELLDLASKERVSLVMHNKAHEYYVFCREMQEHGRDMGMPFLIQKRHAR